MTRKISVVLTSAALLTMTTLFTVAACGGQDHPDQRPDVHACKAAMVQKFHDALDMNSTATPQPTGTPAACAGVSQEDLLKIVAEIFSTESPGPE